MTVLTFMFLASVLACVSFAVASLLAKRDWQRQRFLGYMMGSLLTTALLSFLIIAVLVLRGHLFAGWL